ncbi:protein NETWORKED 2A-like isoform X2 [Panicum miliaceum]|uniref:Protein NETWORKED 2A-like isoform X2 n=1 Tax=Panicum miliaceum TaxID=4540 RepID=A0A3L6R0I6_PANMI|nr:protein NETWORKED 2A-like isoform X2 [Panicum miliaceum]
MTELKELKSANATKDDEIRSLRRMLSSLQTKFNTSPLQCAEKSEESPKANTSKANIDPNLEDKETGALEEYMKNCQDEEPPLSSLEEKFRDEISRILEESLDFWLRFSTSYRYIQKFQSSFDKAKVELDRLTDPKAQEGIDPGSASQSARKQDSTALEKTFRDLSTDLQVWLEKNVLLQGELESRFSSLCSIQEEISRITTVDETNEAHFTPFQAAKFQGEVSNMKQENNKVTKELQAGIDHVRGLQVEIGRALLKLKDNIELSIGRSNRAQQNFRSLSVKAGDLEKLHVLIDFAFRLFCSIKEQRDDRFYHLRNINMAEMSLACSVFLLLQEISGEYHRDLTVLNEDKGCLAKIKLLQS